MKNLAALMFILFFALSGYAQVPTTGLIAYYPFSGNANDLSGNGYNGVVGGAINVADRFGNLNSAYSFDGISNFIAVNNSPIYNNIDTSITISQWFKTNDPVLTTQPGFLTAVAQANTLRSFYIYLSDANFSTDAINFGIFDAGDALHLSSYPSNYYDYNWHNLICSYSYASGIMNIYVDNNLVHTNYIGHYLIEQSTVPFTIGCYMQTNGGGYRGFFSGLIDDVRIYNRALNTAEINSIYYEGVGVVASASPSSICMGTNSDLSATYSSGIIRWWDAFTGGTMLGTSASGANFSVFPTITTTYYAEGYSISGATSRVSVTVTVSTGTAPSAPTGITAFPASVLCGSSTNLYAISSSGIIRWWDSPTGGNLIGTSQSGMFLNIIPTTNTTYYAEAYIDNLGSQTFSYSGSIVSWTVPVGVTSISIDAKGASGGYYVGASGGRGARMVGVFAVTPGNILSILVGQCPGSTSNSYPAGGGGTFVALGSSYSTATPLIVAGGGGAAYTGAGVDALTTTSGTGTNAGTNGNGASVSWCGGGGGGFYTSGANDLFGGYYGGVGFRQGGVVTGNHTNHQLRAFGGGAEADRSGSCYLRAGAGGGYSGGSGINSMMTTNIGQAGGSYNSGTNQQNYSGNTGNTGNGEVIITWRSAGCASSRDSTSITMTGIPVLSSVLSNPSTISCGGTSDISAVSVGNIIKWWDAPTGGNLIGSTISGAALTVSPLVTTIYYAEAYSSFCVSPRIADTVNVTILSPGSVSAFPTTVNCGSSTNLYATTSTGIISWWDSPIGGSLIGTSQSGTFLNILPSTNTTYYAEVFTGAIGTQTFSYSGSIVSWTVPVGVTNLTIEAWGAQGGTCSSTNNYGARMKGDFSVASGQKLQILVGQNPNTTNYGGGGTFVATGSSYTTASPLIVAGGGGGSALSMSSTAIGTTSTTGQFSYSGGIGGSLGSGSSTTNGGAGFYTNGGGGARAFVNGGAGQSGGGFGGGGYGSGCTTFGGGGGGYSGGGSDLTNGNGGGGGSYNSGTNQSNSSGVRSGNGQVIITWLNTGCLSTRDSVVISMNGVSINSVAATPSTITCGGNSNISAVSVGSVIRWWDAPTGGNMLGTTQSGTLFSVSPTTTTVYYAEAFVNPCISNRVSVTVFVNILPAPTSASAFPSSVTCGGSTNLSAVSIGSDIRWWDAPTGGNLLGSSISGAFFSVSPTSSVSYYAEAFIGSCISSRVVDTVIVTPLQVPTLVTATPSSVACGGSTNLSAVSIGNNIRWWNAATGGNLLGSSSSGAFFTVYPSIITNFYAEAYLGSCISSRVLDSVTITPLLSPSSVTAFPLSVTCGSSTNLYANTSTGVIRWWDSSTGGNFIGTTQSGTFLNILPSINTTYYAEAYSGSSGSQTYTYSGSIVSWTVPVGITNITITAKGASGGYNGGYGAYMQGDFIVTSGDQLKILVGQTGTQTMNGANNISGGGGGGSFVTTAANNPLIVAGGGGGNADGYTLGPVPCCTSGMEASLTIDGNPYPGGNNGGIGGYGGTSISGAGSGAGFLGNGQQGYSGSIALAFINGGTAGLGNSGAGNGGFGGGAGGYNSGTGQRGGGGGGYSGGGGGVAISGLDRAGGGGGSYNSGSNQINMLNTTSGNGQVTIAWSTPICISSRDSVSITMLGAPVVSSISAIPSSYSCGGSSNISAASAGGIIRWWDAATGGNLLGTTISGAFFTVSPTTTTIYYAEVYLSSCVSSRASVTITVIPLATPSSVTVFPNTVTCGSSTNLMATSTGVIRWWDAATAGNVIGTSQSGVFFNIIPTSNSTFYAEAYTSNTGSQTFSYTGNIITWVVPTGVTFIDIDAKGASGGYRTGTTPGKGARIKGTFSVSSGDILSILVGQSPGLTTLNVGGGGGTFVALGSSYSIATPMVVAGGGGGAFAGTGVDASINTSGTGTNPGTNGNGAQSVMCGGGGGGFYTSGGDDTQNGYRGGKGYQLGGAGAVGHTGYQSGGFGGGAEADYIGSCNVRAGAGGGYSGGSGINNGVYVTIGQAGGSFNAGTNQVNTSGYQTGNGEVVISWDATVCASIRTSVSITITGAPIITSSIAIPSSISCSATSNISAISTGNIIYWWDAATGGNLIGSSVSSALFTVSPTITTTYYAEAFSLCSSTSRTPVIVNVIPQPTNPTIASISTNNICPNYLGNISLSVSGGSGSIVGWFTTDCDNTSIGTGNPLSITTPVTSTTYWANWQVQGCPNSTCVSTTITVLSLSTPATSIAASQSSVCSGSSSTLTFTGGTLGDLGYWRWFSGSCGGTSLGTGLSAIVTPTVLTTYYLRAEGTCNSTTCVSRTITISTLSTIATNASATQNTVCSGTSITISVVGGTLGTSAKWRWYSGSCGGTTVGSNSPKTVTPTITTTYYCRAEGTCNTTLCVSTAVTVNTNSVIATTATALPVCPGDATTLGITGGSLGTGANWNWYEAACGGTFIGSGLSLTQSPSMMTTYYVRAEGTCNTTLCKSKTVSLYILSTPATTVSATIDTICSGASTVLSLTGGSLGTAGIWKWYSNSCGGTAIGTGILRTVNPTTLTTYFVRAEGACNSTLCLSVTVTVNTISTTATSITVSSGTLCAGDSTIFGITGGNLGIGANWYWYSGSCGGTYISSGTSLILFPPVTTTYYIRAENVCGSTTCKSKIVNVIQLPSIPSAITGNTLPTTGNTEIYSITNVTGVTYTWSAPSAWVGTSTSNSVTFTVGIPNGIVSVVPNNSCGAGLGRTLIVGSGGYQVSGNFTYDNLSSSILDSVWVFLMYNGNVVDSIQADANGYYQFTNVPNGAYNVNATSHKKWDGVNVTDAVKVKRHFAGSELFASSLRLHAGDVNNSLLINTTDGIKIVRRFAGSDTSFIAGDWVFEKPLGGDSINTSSYLNDTVIINNANVVQDYKGLCYGDVNGSYLGIPTGAKSAKVKINYHDVIKLNSNESFDLPIFASDNLNIGAVSLILNYPKNLISISDVYCAKSNDELFYNVIGNELRIGWFNDINPLNLNNGDNLINIRFKTTSNFKQGDVINIEVADNYLCELADETGEPINGAILKTYSIEHINNQDLNNVISNNNNNLEIFPNPANDNVNIRYYIVNNGLVRILLYNVLGEKVTDVINNSQLKGIHKSAIDINSLPSGIYTVKMTVDNSIIVKRLVISR